MRRKCIMVIVFAGTATCIQNCAAKLGIKIVHIKVHLDGGALVALKQALTTEFSMDFNTLSSATKFFGGIFDMVNDELEPYGVQVKGNFSRLLLDQYDPQYDHTKCTEFDPVGLRSKLAASALRGGAGGGAGNHLVVFFCPELVNKAPTSRILSEGRCRNLLGVTFSEIRALKDLIHNGVMRMLSHDVYRTSGEVSSSFNRALCSNVNRCTSDPSFGEFRWRLKRITHLAAEKYILRKREPTDYRKTESWSHLTNKDHDIVVYPTADYSNEDELFSDAEMALH